MECAGEGLITYMRTDGLQISDEALAQVRDAVAASFGPDYVPKAPRIYKCAATRILRGLPMPYLSYGISDQGLLNQDAPHLPVTL